MFYYYQDSIESINSTMMKVLAIILISLIVNSTLYAILLQSVPLRDCFFLTTLNLGPKMNKIDQNLTGVNNFEILISQSYFSIV